MGIYDLLEDAAVKTIRRSDAGEPVINGFMLGVVTQANNKDFPGMVKVELYTRDDQKNISDWMHVVTPYGGKDWGVFMMPELNDEVLVFFLEGSIHKPCVLGSIFRSADSFHKAAYNKDNFIKKFKTPNGIEVTFYDEKDKDYIDIKTHKGTVIRMDDDKEKVTISDKAATNKVEIDIKNGIVTVLGKTEVMMKSGEAMVDIKGKTSDILIKGNNVKVEGNKVILKAQGSMSMEGAVTDVKASGSLNLKGDATATLKGAVVKIN